MKEIKSNSGKVLIFRILALFAIVLVFFLISGTIFSVTRPDGASPLLRIGGSRDTAQEQRLDDFGSYVADTSIFTGIGRLRIPLQNSSTLIISIAFPYPNNDRPFSEELAVKVGEFRSIATGYFSSLPAGRPGETINIDEDAAKAEILRRFNSNLRLGKIQVLFFNDLIVLE